MPRATRSIATPAPPAACPAARMPPAASASTAATKNPTDIVTDGVHLWVVNDRTTDKVFKYTLSGDARRKLDDHQRRGQSDRHHDSIRRTCSDLWIVDNATDRVYQYDNAASRTSGSQSPVTSFALAAGNTNPQGIADPPAGYAASLTSDTLDLPDTRHARNRSAIDFLPPTPTPPYLPNPAAPRPARAFKPMPYARW